jgi:hypothetical protein
LEPEPAADAGKELLTPVQLLSSGNSRADAAEYDQTEPLRQFKSVLRLRRQLIASEIFAGYISSQLIVASIDAVSVEGRAPASCAEKSVIGQDLSVSGMPIMVGRDEAVTFDNCVRLSYSVIVLCAPRRISCNLNDTCADSAEDWKMRLRILIKS